MNAEPPLLTALRPGTIILVLSLIIFPLGWHILSANEDELVCEICGEVIQHGQYIILDGHTYHNRCYERCLKCAICRKPILDEYVKDKQGQAYHPECYDQAPKCALCGDPIIQGRYYTGQSGTVYHQHCYDKAAKCELCQEPLGKGPVIRLGQHRYHQSCFDNALKCDICGFPIQGEYRIDMYGRNICSKHLHDQACCICDYPRIKTKLSDGRGLCERCSTTAILKEDQAERLFNRIKNDLHHEFGLEIDIKIAFQLIDQKTLFSLGTETEPSMLGKFLRQTKTLSVPILGDKTISEDFTIVILYGLPRMLFVSVAAHELTHAWQALHCRDDQSVEVKEGTAELIAYLYLEKRNEFIWMDRIANNEVTLYRTGFEKALDLYKKLGLNRFRQRVTELDRF